MYEWEQFIPKIERAYGKKAVETWVRSLSITRFDACNIYLDVEDPFVAAWVTEHLIPLAEKELKNQNGHKIALHLAQNGPSPNPPLTAPPAISSLYVSNPLTPHCIFSQFIVNQVNMVPYHILYNAVQQDQKEGYNPLFVFGPKGVGKTHLLMACAQALQDRGKSVLFVSGETFTEHVVKAIRGSKMGDFRHSYRNIDALVIDDIQTIGKKHATQEELFHTFNTLHVAGKLIILSANVNPQLLEDVEPRLISRFEWGITLPLKSLDESRYMKELIQMRAQFYSLPLDKPAIEAIHKRCTQAHVLSRIVNALIRSKEAKQAHKTAPMSLAQCLPYIEKVLHQTQEEGFNDQWILQTVAECFGVRIEDIVAKSQTKEAVLPRQIAMFLLRKELNFPFMKIGKLFNKDHSTVMSSIKQVEKSIDKQDSESLYYLNAIRRKILQKR